MSQKIYLWILKIGVYLSLIPLFFVIKTLLFPYITSKQIPFNILIEVLLIFLIAFWVKYPSWRPKASYITYGLFAFFAVMVLSCFTGVGFNLSFWGDIERMLGAFHIVHFLGLYLIMITVFRTWEDWKWFLNYFIVVGVFIAFAGFGENAQTYGVIGNTAYVAGYMIFNMFLSVLLFAKEKNKLLKWIYILPFIIHFISFKSADATGGWAGLMFGIPLTIFLYGIAHKNKKVKVSTLGVTFLLVLMFFNFFVFNRDNFLTDHSVFWSKLTKEMSLSKNTFQTRLISWRAAYKDFKTHPVLGVGHGNYAVIFDKYFDPTFYNYTKSETYFDRAHNNIVDITSTTGILGLLAYLSILVALFFYLFRGVFKGKITVHDFAIIGGLIGAYFVQNLAVFDSFSTYIALMVVLAYVVYLNRSDEEIEIEEDEELNNKEIYTYVIAGIILLTIAFQYNIKPYQMLVGTINGQKAKAQGNLDATVQIYRDALSKNTVLDRDSRMSLIRLFLSESNLKKLKKEDPDQVLDWVISLAEENVKYNENDSMNQMVLSQILNVAASRNSNNPEKFEYYWQRAMEAMDKSIEASPERIPIYYQKSQLYITHGEGDKALETLEYAKNLNLDYPNTFCHLSRTNFFYKNEEKGFEYLDQCIDKKGSGMLNPAGLVKSYINHYVELDDIDRLIPLYEQLVRLEKKDVKHKINLAKLYAQVGEKEKAIKMAEEAIALDPTTEKYAQEFIEGLK